MMHAARDARGPYVVAFRTLLVLSVLAGAAACATASGGVRGTAEDGRDTAAAGVPGFDTREYPGDDVMRAWFDTSPYRWVGYYLPAPCHTGTSWLGRRPVLREIGYGFAVLFVGEQDWAAMGRPDTIPAAPRCASANLTPERGAGDAAAAVAAAQGEGFPAGTVIFLDVERVETVSPALEAYVGAWTRELLDDGRYVPGLYAHDRNVPDLLGVLEAEFARAGRATAPVLWVAHADGFDLDRHPADSGYRFARVWQGSFDVRESWAGTTLRIDANVASVADPSGGR